MHLRDTLIITLITASLVAGPAVAAVNVSASNPLVKPTADGESIEQTVALANTVADYELTYTAEHSADGTEVLSDSWGWTQGYVPLGMTGPSQPNWYYQAFFNWQFDDESIHLRPAKMTVVRESGESGMVEYSWETANASVWIRFAMVSGSDKLLVFGGYEPKGPPIERAFLKFVCYPAFFPTPRERAVTTALGTRRPGDRIDLDLAQERWVLYEDTSRPGAGSAGMIIGTPDVFESVEIPVGDYGIVTTLELKPEARRFAVALYDFPSMPDYQQTRDYFTRLGDREAEALTQMAAGDLDAPLPAMPVDEERVETILAAGREMLDRPEERWAPNPEPLDFPWAAQIPGEPIDTAVFVRRWEAWETMELARRLEMDVEHLYWDSEDQLSYPRAWPYASATGVGAIPFGVAARRAAQLASDPDKDLYVIAGVETNGVPGVTRTNIAERVAEGAGLLLVGSRGLQDDWPAEMLASEDPELAQQITAGFDPSVLPGFEEADPAEIVKVWRYGAGRVVSLHVALGTYSSLMPRHSLSEGILEAMDRWLGLCARAAAVAAGRDMPATVTFGAPTANALPVVVDGVPEGASLRVRIMDDLGRVLESDELNLPLANSEIALPALPPSRTCSADLLVVDPDGNTVGVASTPLAPDGGPQITAIGISPAMQSHELAPPQIDLPGGGTVECTATIDAPRQIEGAQLRWEARDAFDRLLATATSDVPAAGGEVSATLDLPKPVTVCHVLSAALTQGDAELDYDQARFTMTAPYPYDDFTALMWNTATTSPLMLNTDRLCYEWGADMCDPANTLRADDARAALIYDLRSRSGLRMVPYVTRIYAEEPVDNQRQPSLSDPEYLAQWTDWLTVQGRQAAPYQPAAYTLGDENFLYRGEGEVGWHPAAIAAFREWLEAKYGTIARLNEAWGGDYAAFDEVEPMLLEEVVGRAAGFAPWIDHKTFLDESFADTHNTFRDVLRAQDEDAKVGWDGILGYTWKSGYNFTELTEECDLNQTYISRWLQGRLVTDFRRDDALTGKWGNRVADNEDGWHAFPWACLMEGDNSVWWWTSWGCDYIPFYPDLSQSNYGKWFFEAVRETTAGPGRMIVHAERDPSPIAVLYAKRDMFAGAIAAQMVQNQPWAGDNGFHREHEDMLKVLFDLGYDPRHISLAELAGGISPDDHRVLVLPLATCLSDSDVAALREYVEAGGTLIADGRVGILTGDGAFRDTRPLDDVFGISTPAGIEGFTAEGSQGEVAQGFSAHVLEPDLRVDGGLARGAIDGTPVLIRNSYGEGTAYTLNFTMGDYTSERVTEGSRPRQAILDEIIRGAGVVPLAEITGPDGDRPVGIHQFGFTDGAARYLCVQQDILLPSLEDQQCTITLPEPAVVYDVRADRQVGDGPVREWDATLSRGYPLVYAILPYEVSSVSVQAPDAAERGANAEVTVAVEADGEEAGYHVVRVDVYAPGAEEPHRQYSQNADCDGAPGMAVIPFALSDEAGTWRIVAHDAASGVSAETTVEVR